MASLWDAWVVTKQINYFGDGIYHFDEGKNKVVVENSKIITVISNKGDEKNI